MFPIYNIWYLFLCIIFTYSAFSLGISPYTSRNFNIFMFAVKILNACLQIRSLIGLKCFGLISKCWKSTDWLIPMSNKLQCENPSYASDQLIWKDHPSTSHTINHIIFYEISFITTKTRTSNYIIFCMVNFSLSVRALSDHFLWLVYFSLWTGIFGPWTVRKESREPRFRNSLRLSHCKTASSSILINQSYWSIRWSWKYASIENDFLTGGYSLSLTYGSWKYFDSLKRPHITC